MLNSFEKDFLIKNLPFWDRLTELQQKLVLSNARFLKYKNNTTIHHADNNCVGVIFIKSGTLRTYILSEDGREITLYRLSKGDVCILSASCILSNINFDVYVDVDVDAEVIVVGSAAFKQICEENIYAENFSYKISADRFSDVMWAIQQILFMSFDKRLAIFLLDESVHKGKDFILLTHEQIAKYIGSAREVVSRMLKYFANEGFVELSRGKIKIINQEGLKHLM